MTAALPRSVTHRPTPVTAHAPACPADAPAAPVTATASPVPHERQSDRTAMSAAKASPTTISGTVSRYPDWLSRVTPSAAMTTNGAAQATTMTVISAGLNRDLPLTPAVARARTATVAV